MPLLHAPKTEKWFAASISKSFRYLENKSFAIVTGFYHGLGKMVKLFQLLSYIRQLDYYFGFIVDQEYLIISFKLSDFLEFIGANKNHYQVQKLGKFLRSLQTLPPMLRTISNICF